MDELDKLYKSVIEYMNDNYPFMTVYVIRMGRPVATVDSPLAFVAWSKENEELTLNLNYDNLVRLSDEERVFVFLHESFHVLLSHNKLELPDPNKANIASDIIINDYLVQAGLDRVAGLIYGDEAIGMDSFGMTVKEVYALLPDSLSISIGGALGEILNGGGCGENGVRGDSIPDAVTKDIGGDAPQEIKDAQQEKSPQGGKLAGSGFTNLEEWAVDHKAEFAWAEILKEIAPKAFWEGKDGKRHLTFNNLNRKVAWQAPEIVLPVYRDSDGDGGDPNKKPSMVLAIDTSGSIGHETQRGFFRIAKSIPTEHINLRTISFTTVVEEFDIAGSPKFRSGGTAFGPISTWVNNEYGKNYPDAVVVFTDGYGTFYPPPTDSTLSKWYWFLTPQGMLRPHIKRKSKRVAKLDEFVR